MQTTLHYEICMPRRINNSPDVVSLITTQKQGRFMLIKQGVVHFQELLAVGNSNQWLLE